MPSKLLLRHFQSGHTYHLRHVAKKGTTLFQDDKDYKSFLLTLSYYLRFPGGTPLSWVPRMNPKTLAAKQGAAMHHGQLPCTLHAFLLLPDHFHLVLTENIGSPKPGISELMRRVSVGYAMTYRQKYGGAGTIYQGKYKMIELDQDTTTGVIAGLHTHPEVNSTYLRDPLHSSLPDYDASPRPWLTPLPLVPTTSALPPRLLLD